MTIVAYKNGIIASDSKASWDDLHLFNCKKVVKAPDGTIGGGAGHVVWINSFNDWILSNRKQSWDYFNKDSSGLFITTDRQVYIVDSGGIMPAMLLNDCIAIGSGKSIALGAMDANATAEEAVRIAIIREDGCAGLVYTEELGPPIEKSIRKGWWGK